MATAMASMQKAGCRLKVPSLSSLLGSLDEEAKQDGCRRNSHAVDVARRPCGTDASSDSERCAWKVAPCSLASSSFVRSVRAAQAPPAIHSRAYLSKLQPVDPGFAAPDGEVECLVSASKLRFEEDQLVKESTFADSCADRSQSGTDVSAGFPSRGATDELVCISEPAVDPLELALGRAVREFLQEENTSVVFSRGRGCNSDTVLPNQLASCLVMVPNSTSETRLKIDTCSCLTGAINAIRESMRFQKLTTNIVQGEPLECLTPGGFAALPRVNGNGLCTNGQPQVIPVKPITCGSRGGLAGIKSSALQRGAVNYDDLAADDTDTFAVS